jgi:rSAM/selenodomain-associated transferase 1
MAREPRAGRSKTRLAHKIGTVWATRFARDATASLLARLARDPRWTTTVAVTPDQAANRCRAQWKVRCIPQGPGDLGARMQRLFTDARPGPVIIIGTDVPAITSNRIAHAFDALGDSDVVLGPAVDGGYWLIGMRRVPRVRRPFQSVRWSTRHALTDTLANLGNAHIELLDTLADVDTEADYNQCHNWAPRVVRAPA